MPSPPARQSPARRKLYMRAKEVGLTDDERIELACYILRRDITSWKQLDEGQVMRMLDAVEGYELIAELKRMRGPSHALGQEHDQQDEDDDPQ